MCYDLVNETGLAYSLMNPLLIELLKGLFTLTALVVGSLIALKVYFRQKEYELAKQRYLEGGVDVLAAELEIIIGVVSHNYARALNLCKYFRDSGNQFQPSELSRGFLQLDQSKFHQVAHHRVHSLIGSNLIWNIYQSAMAGAHSANSLIAEQIPETMRILSAQDPALADRDSVCEDMVRELEASHDSCTKFASLARELHTLGLLLEAERLDLKAIANFHDRVEVKALVTRLQAEFGANV